MTTATEAIKYLIPQYLVDPADAVIRGILIDALLEEGKIEEAEKIQQHWEPRAWLIAKGRHPNAKGEFLYAYYSEENTSRYGWYGLDSYWWLPSSNCDGQETEVDSWRYPPFYVHGVPVIDPKGKTPRLLGADAIQDFCIRWNKVLTEDWKEKLWKWNPPEQQ
jgi:hypothetical protein